MGLTENTDPHYMPSERHRKPTNGICQLVITVIVLTVYERCFMTLSLRLWRQFMCKLQHRQAIVDHYVEPNFGRQHPTLSPFIIHLYSPKW